jgi:tetratricopeptide (TPR) repeat protein
MIRLRFFRIPLICLLAVNLLTSTSCSNAPKAGPDEVVVNGILVPKMLPRKEGLGSENEVKEIRTVYDGAIATLKEDTTSAATYLKLATAFIAEGRISGNGGYYSNAAIRMLDKALDAETVSQDEKFQAFSLKSAALLNLHRFQEALEVANQGLAMNAYNAGIYGALVDANVELGHYAEAIQACDKMLSIRPDLRSYSRASYIRQIYGDIPGSIVAMKMAVEAGMPGDEGTEWARATLGELYLANGAPDSATAEFEQSLQFRPNYPRAEMGLAHAAAASGNYESAIAHARSGIKLTPEPGYISYLADLYAMKGDAAKATEIRKDVLTKLEAAEREAQKDGFRHNGARELAQANLAAGKTDAALKLAQQDLKTRPDNIDANELVGWILYRKGDYAGARQYADKAMATGSKNPWSLYKAALIYGHAGNTGRSDSMQTVALRYQPYLTSAAKCGAL